MDAFRRTTTSPRPDIQKMLPAQARLMMKINVTTEQVDRWVMAIIGFV
jgi:hypothetical protein